MLVKAFHLGWLTSISSSKAENFFRFITEELVPVIERDYRTTSEGRTLFGHSLGGGFTLYTMLNHTDAFDSYIASSPVIRGLDEIEISYAASHSDLPVKCFVSVGTREGDAELRRFSNILKSRRYTGFRFREMYIDNGSHCTVAPQCYTEGIRFVFDRAVSLPPEMLSRYAGRYEGNNFSVTIQFAGDRLIAVTDRIRGSNELFPVSKTLFFTKGWPSVLTFTLDTDGVPLEIISRGSARAKKIQ